MKIYKFFISLCLCASFLLTGFTPCQAIPASLVDTILAGGQAAGSLVDTLTSIVFVVTGDTLEASTSDLPGDGGGVSGSLLEREATLQNDLLRAGITPVEDEIPVLEDGIPQEFPEIGEGDVSSLLILDKGFSDWLEVESGSSSYAFVLEKGMGSDFSVALIAYRAAGAIHIEGEILDATGNPTGIKGVVMAEPKTAAVDSENQNDDCILIMQKKFCPLLQNSSLSGPVYFLITETPKG